LNFLQDLVGEEGSMCHWKVGIQSPRNTIPDPKEQNSEFYLTLQIFYIYKIIKSTKKRRKGFVMGLLFYSS